MVLGIDQRERRGVKQPGDPFVLAIIRGDGGLNARLAGLAGSRELA